MNPCFFEFVCIVWLLLAVFVFVMLQFVAAPFGRHVSDKWGRMVNNKIAWILMEFPSFFIMFYFLFRGNHFSGTFSWILFLLWITHYTNRTFVYPLRIKSTLKKMPLVIVLSGIIFNCVNAGLNGYYLSELTPPGTYDNLWLNSPSFIFGSLFFIVGMYINVKSDNILINLRRPGETGYKIPQGFLFKYLSAPNLFGEIIQWSGFAIMAWNLPALTFMVWTTANLVPRAKNHHDWYLKNFENYPKKRKAVIPFLY